MTAHDASPSMTLAADTGALPVAPRRRGAPVWVAYVVGVVALCLATAADMMFQSFFAQMPFVLSAIAVVLAAWFGGLIPGLVTTLLGTVVGYTIFIYPMGEPTWRGVGWTAMFVALAVLISILTESRLRATRSATQSYEQLIGVFHGLADGVFLEDPARGLIYANDAAAHLTGFASGADLQRATLGAVIERFEFLDAHGQPIPPQSLPDQRAMRGEQDAEILLNVRDRSTGQGRWWAMKATPLARGRSTAAVMIFRDVTTQQQAEAALAASERRFRALIERSADAFALLDQRGAFLFTSPAVSRVLGYREEELRAVSVFSIVHPDDVAAASALLASLRTAASAPPASFRMRNRDGRWRWIEVTGSNLMDDPAVRATLLNLRDITDRKAAEDALAASERRLRALITNSADAVAVMDAEGTLIYASPSTERVLGYAPDAFVSTNGFEYIHPDDLPQVREMIATARAEPGGQAHGVFRLRHRDHGYRWVEATATNLLHDPAVRGIVENYHDITERRQAETRQEFLLTASRQLTTALEDEEALVAVASAAVPGFAAGCAVELIGAAGKLRRAFTILPAQGGADPFATTPVAAYVARAIITGQAALFAPTTPVRSQNGAGNGAASTAPTTMLVVPLVARGVTLGAVTFDAPADAAFNREDRAAAEEFANRLALGLAHARLYAEMQSAETKYRLLFDSIRDAAVVADEEGHYIDANPAITDLLGYTVDEVRQLRVGAFAADPAQAWEEFVAHGVMHVWGGETELRRKDGTPVPIEGWVTPVKVPGASLYLALWRDISERVAYERSQQEFIAIMTHELRNPLASLKGFAQLMQRRGQYDEKAVERIIAQSDRLERLTRDLRDVARFTDGEVELNRTAIALPALIASAVQEVRATTTLHSFAITAPEDLPPVFGDSDRVAQVLQNLLSNAVKYSPEGGEVTVSAETQGEFVSVSVTDQGIGIPPDAIEKIFRRFYRAENARKQSALGMGVGLHISRALIEAHGGAFTVESTVGVGSTFRFTLPVAMPPD